MRNYFTFLKMGIVKMFRILAFLEKEFTGVATFYFCEKLVNLYGSLVTYPA